MGTNYLTKMLLLGAVGMGSMMFGMTSCSSDDKDNNVQSIALNPASKEIGVNETFDIVVSFTPEGATNKKVSWSSDHPEIAKVENGKVTGVKDGPATITCTTEDGGKTATCNVTVKTTAKDIFKDGTTIVLKANDKSNDSYEFDYKKENAVYNLKNALINNGDVTDTCRSVCKVEVVDNKIFKFVLDTCPWTIDTENNTYTLTYTETTTDEEGNVTAITVDGKDYYQNFQCIVNGTDIVPTLTYKTYVAP